MEKSCNRFRTQVKVSASKNPAAKSTVLTFVTAEQRSLCSQGFYESSLLIHDKAKGIKYSNTGHGGTQGTKKTSGYMLTFYLNLICTFQEKSF